MSRSDSPEQGLLREDVLASLAELNQSAAQTYLLDLLERTNSTQADVAGALALAAGAAAEHTPQNAICWLQLARTLNSEKSDPVATAQIAHAQARLHLQEGELAAAENALLQAQEIWRGLGDTVSVARTCLGLTQILALQGKYAAAQLAVEETIVILEVAVSSAPVVTPLLVTALRNQGNLAGYTHHHPEALAAYDRALQIIGGARGLHDGEIPLQLTHEAACIDVSRAVDLMALARFEEAEQALRGAIHYFERAGHKHYNSYAHSNLASLYARTGQYTQALAAYEQAIQTLYGADVQLEAMSVEELQATDVMLLDRAQVFLALNLQQEALHALLFAERLFLHAQRPFELAQTLYTRGLLQIQEQAWDAAAVTLQQAEAGFAALQMLYWQNRTRLARVGLLHQQGDLDAASALLASLLNDEPTALASQWYGWDLGTATELFLQQLQLSLHVGNLRAARQAAATVDALFRLHFADVPSPSVITNDLSDIVVQEERVASFGVPHLRFAYLYALGRIERAAGDLSAARHYFQQAVTLLESQRASLPLEEIRIAFLGGKGAVYTDWLLTLLDEPNAEVESMHKAFAVVERARSRALLELLLATLDEQTLDANGGELSAQAHITDVTPEDGDLATQQTLLRRHLHWLYNQLLGQDGVRRLQTEQLQELRELEFRLERLRSKNRLSVAATPVDVHALQSVLQTDEHVLAYYIADEEILLFAVTTTEIRLFRHLCSVADVQKAQRDLLFQMGRLRTGETYLHALDERAQRLLRHALHRLYQLLLQPAAQFLQEQRLKIIPYGLLHQLPFHAFWTGEEYLIECFDCCYVPSASVAVHQAGRIQPAVPLQTWSGLAVTDQGIPETATEVTTVARFFPQPQLYLGAAASRAGLVAAAQEADILHISTHGLMRHDNPLFSSLKLADGWIDVREIYRLPLRARLVVLSACRSGFSQIEQGDEVMGLVRGFLAAGANTLLVSQWDVDDAYAPHFMVQFYRRLVHDGLDPAAALRSAQRHAITAGHHPYWWAPFFVIG